MGFTLIALGALLHVPEVVASEAHDRHRKRTRRPSTATWPTAIRACAGMSSRFAAAICGHVIRRQTGLASWATLPRLARSRAASSSPWRSDLRRARSPSASTCSIGRDAGLLDRFVGNCAAAGLPRDRFVAWKERSAAITPDALRARLPSGAGAIHPHRRRSRARKPDA